MLLITAHVLVTCSFLLPSYSSSLSSTLILVVSLISSLFFSTMRLFFFFLYYEFSLFPISLLILLFGYQPEKVSSTLLLLSYTLVCSLPLFYFVSSFGGSIYGLGSCGRPVLIFLLGVSFIVKSPIYVLHAWLPKAHVEAPLLGSVALSGIMLKLGGYGFLNLCVQFCSFFYFFMFVSLSGSVICSIVCFRVHDLKAVVAYSSVVHMGVVTVGAITGSETGFWVAVSIIVSHTLISPYLFILANEMYLCLGSRSFTHGFQSNASSFLLLFLVMFWGLNFGLPPFLPFWVEVSFFNAVGASSVSFFLPLALSSFLSFLFCV